MFTLTLCLLYTAFDHFDGNFKNIFKNFSYIKKLIIVSGLLSQLFFLREYKELLLFVTLVLKTLNQNKTNLLGPKSVQDMLFVLPYARTHLKHAKYILSRNHEATVYREFTNQKLLPLFDLPLVTANVSTQPKTTNTLRIAITFDKLRMFLP